MTSVVVVPPTISVLIKTTDEPDVERSVMESLDLIRKIVAQVPINNASRKCQG